MTKGSLNTFPTGAEEFLPWQPNHKLIFQGTVLLPCSENPQCPRKNS